MPTDNNGILFGGGYAPGENPLDKAKARLGSAYQWWVQNVINSPSMQAPTTPVVGTPAAGSGRGMVNPPTVAQMPPSRPIMAPAGAPQRPTNGPIQGPALDELMGSVSPAERAGILAQFADGPNGPAPTPQAAQAPQPAAQAPQGRPDQGAIYDGLINGGAAMLQAKNLMSGLGAGAQAFNEGYDGKVAKDKAEQTPKVVPLADGAFTLLAYPNGTQKVVPNAEVQKYLGDQQTDRMAAALQKIGYGAQVNAAVAGQKLDQKQGQEASGEVAQVRQQLAANKEAQDTLKRRDWQTQAQGLPGVAGLAGAFGTQGAIDNRKLAAVKTAAWLKSSAQLKGALSNVEGARLDRPLPALTDSNKVWDDYLRDQNDLLETILKRQQELEAKGQAPLQIPTPPGAPARAATAPAAPASGGYQVPGLSAKASAYFK